MNIPLITKSYLQRLAVKISDVTCRRIQYSNENSSLADHIVYGFRDMESWNA
jgi:hypothetical protein